MGTKRKEKGKKKYKQCLIVYYSANSIRWNRTFPSAFFACFFLKNIGIPVWACIMLGNILPQFFDELVFC